MSMLTTDLVASNGLELLEAELGPAAHVDRRRETLFGNEPGRTNKGDTVQIPKPPLFDVNESWQANYQTVDEDSVPLTMDRPVSVDIEVTDAEMHLELSNFERQINKPAMSRLSHKWAQIVVGNYKKSYHFVGTPGTHLSALSDFLSVGVIMDEFLAPRDGSRAIFLNPAQMAAAAGVLALLNNDAAKNKEHYRSGMVRADVGGFDWHMSQIMPNHTAGANTGGGKIDGADQVGASLLTDDYTASSAAFKEGDIISWAAGYYYVNPITKDRINTRLAKVVASADVTSDATGDETTVPIGPTLVASGKTQNITGSIADGEALLLFGHASTYASSTFAQGMAWPKSAIALGMVELKTPGGMDQGSTKTDEELNLSMRFTRRWDQDTSKWKLRYQTFGGTAALRPEWIVRTC